MECMITYDMRTCISYMVTYDVLYVTVCEYYM